MEVVPSFERVGSEQAVVVLVSCLAVVVVQTGSVKVVPSFEGVGSEYAVVVLVTGITVMPVREPGHPVGSSPKLGSGVPLRKVQYHFWN